MNDSFNKLQRNVWFVFDVFARRGSANSDRQIILPTIYDAHR